MPKNKVHQLSTVPLGVDGIAYAKKTYGWEYPEFTVPEEVAKRFEVGIKFRGEAAQNAWETKFREYEAAYPELAAEYKSAFVTNQLT